MGIATAASRVANEVPSLSVMGSAGVGQGPCLQGLSSSLESLALGGTFSRLRDQGCAPSAWVFLQIP